MQKAETLEAPNPATLDQLAVASENAARLLRAMGHGQRLRILCMLLQGPRSSGEIARALAVREPAASQQLALLRGEGLIDARRDGQRVFYSIVSPVIAGIVGVLQQEFCPPDPA